ncbi:Ig-like domain repeat protein [Acidicapsa ligni]|uniref:Ig-like domain repeat protein n=1 Tax=Acidicapsa ligni TaxID=542300 RepID=UPI0021DF55C9|nr:Ig-like domain repeat protein [Acidicapsa ligni]
MYLLRSIRQALAATTLLSATLAFGATIGSHAARQLVTRPVDETNLVTLHGNTHAAAMISSNERGIVADSFPMHHMLLQLKRTPEQETALGKLMDQLHTPGSAKYHHWLSEADWDSQFGVNQQDVQKVTSWLQSHGFTVSGVLPDGMVIDFSGTAAMVREAFHTEIHNIELPNGEKHFANNSDPMIPAALADVVFGPTALSNFKPHSARARRTPVSIDGKGKVHTNYTVDPSEGQYPVTPGDAQTIYNVSPLLTAGFTGKGKVIGLIEDGDAYDIDSNGTSSDWKTFMSTFGLTKYGGTQTTVHPTGAIYCAPPGDANNGDDVEVGLDIEYASATAPGANVVVESCQDTYTGFGGLIAVENLVSAATITTPVLSMSYGLCEAGNGAANNAAFSYAYQHGAARGVSIFVSSGDEGSRSCDANQELSFYGIGTSGYATSPYNVAVGGTDFSDGYTGDSSTYWNATNNADYASAKDYIPEIPWNSSCASQLIAQKEGFSLTYGPNGFCNSALGASTAPNGAYYFFTTASGSGGPSNCSSGEPLYGGIAGGTCAGQPKPSWQKVNGNPADGVRDIPDVSLFASSGIWGHYFVICTSNPDEVDTYGTLPCTGTPDTWSGVGGTSGSAPMMAGIQTLINQYTNQNAGNPNYIYYQLAAAQYASKGAPTCTASNETNTCAFHDVTLGDNNTPCTYAGTLDGVEIEFNCYAIAEDAYFSGGFPVGVGSVSNTTFEKSYGTNTGWDFATGIGTVNAFNLAKGFKAASPGGDPLVATVAVSGDTSSYVYTHGPGSIVYTVTVSGNGSYPTGTIRLSSGTAGIGTGTLQPSSGCSNGGVCTESATITYAPGTLAVGNYTITATYSSVNEEYSQATGTTPLSVIQAGSAATTTTVVAKPATVVAGSSNITLTATVASGAAKPTGTVSFWLSDVAVGTCTLSGGTCSVSTPSSGLTAAGHGVRATYSGSATYASSTATLLVTVTASATTTSLVVSPEAVVTGSTAVLTATVVRAAGNAGVPTGTVTFYSGTSVLGTASLNGDGIATFDEPTAGLALKSYAISAVYGGDTADSTSKSQAVNMTIAPSFTNTTLSASPTFTIGVVNITLTGTVTRICCGTGKFSGTMSFYTGTQLLGTANVNSAGVATFVKSTAGLNGGSVSFSGAYNGDAADRASSSGTVSVTVIAP